MHGQKNIKICKYGICSAYIDNETGFTPVVSVSCSMTFHECSLFIHLSHSGHTRCLLEAVDPQRGRLTSQQQNEYSARKNLLQ